MPHFFIKQEQIKDNIININSDELSKNDINSCDFFHITKALRAKIGEKLKFIDENKVLYSAQILEITKKSLKCSVLSKEKSNRFLEYDLCLVQSVLMNDAQNLAIANATQAGVREIYPVITKNSSVSIENAKEKIEKWQKIAYENFKQCERADLVKINNVSNLDVSNLNSASGNVLGNFSIKNTIIFAEKLQNSTLDSCIADIDKNEKIALVIGPEGGFSDDEFEFFIKKGYKLTSLGSMIYKAPNAIVAGVSNIVSRLEK